MCRDRAGRVFAPGELTEPYVFVKGSTAEFDYPLGKDNVYAWYDGAGGVSLSGIARKVLFAWYFGDPNILISRYVTDGSRVHVSGAGSRSGCTRLHRSCAWIPIPTSW